MGRSLLAPLVYLGVDVGAYRGLKFGLRNPHTKYKSSEKKWQKERRMVFKNHLKGFKIYKHFTV